MGGVGAREAAQLNIVIIFKSDFRVPKAAALVKSTNNSATNSSSSSRNPKSNSKQIPHGVPQLKRERGSGRGGGKCRFTYAHFSANPCPHMPHVAAVAPTRCKSFIENPLQWPGQALRGGGRSEEQRATGSVVDMRDTG